MGGCQPGFCLTPHLYLRLGLCRILTQLSLCLSMHQMSTEASSVPCASLGLGETGPCFCIIKLRAPQPPCMSEWGRAVEPLSSHGPLLTALPDE